MTQPFNPFANAPAQPVPVNYTPPAIAPQTAPPPQAQPAFQAPPQQQQRKIAESLDESDQYDGFTTPFFKHLEGEFDLQIINYLGARSTKLGRACHIMFKVLSSSCPDVIAIGSEWRIAYKYDFERSEKSDKDEYGSDMRSLGLFIQALFNQQAKSGFGVRAAERSLHPHGAQELGRPPVDFAVTPGYVHLSCSLGPTKVKKDPKTGAETARRFRNDLWLPDRGVR